MIEKTDEVVKVEIIDEKLTNKDRWQIIFMPLILLALTAFLGTVIGSCLQNRSFKHNELFRARLERIMTGQREATDILQDVDGATRQIRSNEDFIRDQIQRQVDPEEKRKAKEFYLEKNPMTPSLAILKESKIKLDALGDYTKTLGTNQNVEEAIKEFSTNFDDFINCVEANKDFSNSCSEKVKDLRKSLTKVVEAYSKMQDYLISEYD